MPTKRRKIEIHRLTISGLPENISYGSFLSRLLNKPLSELIMRAGEKWHAAGEISIRNHRLRLRFLSYTQGLRPDVLDTDMLSLQPNPLTPSQTNVEWTHVLGSLKSGRYILLIERNNSGIWPSTIERYLQWVADSFYESREEANREDADQEPVTVSLEAEPGPQFLERMESLDRITEVTVRTVRPNPGWRDLQTTLGEMAGESDARKIDLTMTARRRASLDKQSGILAWIRNAFIQRELGFTAIKGQRGRQTEKFNTEKLGKHATINMDVDERGQVIADDAWEKLTDIMDHMDQ
ncbi:MAG: hypothetical protein ACP5SH_23225 [Syntrophobacteraceae bacterium]